MARHQRLTALRAIKEKVEELTSRKISERQLLAAIDDAEVIEQICRRVPALDLKHEPTCTLNIDGWTVGKGNDGYYRLYKTVEGKTESIYLGKHLDWDKARRKIIKKERQLGLIFF